VRWGLPWWGDTLRADLRLAVRTLGRRPALAAGIVLTLAVAIGVTVAAFGIVQAILLAPLPVRDQDALVVLRMRDASKPAATGDVALTNGFLDSLRDRAPAFTALARVFSAGATPSRPDTVIAASGSPPRMSAASYSRCWARVLR